MRLYKVKILILGERYSENLGDPIICETVYSIVKNRYKHAEIDYFDISGRINYGKYYQITENKMSKLLNSKQADILLKLINPEFYELYNSDRIRYKRTIELYKEYYQDRRYDIAIFAGGALFMNYFSGIIYYLVKRLNANKTKIIFNACGMGNLTNSAIKLLKITFNRPMVKYISLRDSYLRFTQLFNAKCAVEETYDIALNCNGLYIKADKLQAEFGIGVITSPCYYDNQKELVNKFYNGSFSWKLFTNGGPWDQKVAYSILKDIGIEENEFDKYVVKRPLNSQELVSTITSFKTIISYRMHSQIVSASFCIPCYGFIWDDKVSEFFNKIDCSEYCFYPYEVNKCFNKLMSKKINLEILEKSVKKASDFSKNNLIKAISQVVEM